jgi:hypothetical protein
LAALVALTQLYDWFLKPVPEPNAWLKCVEFEYPPGVTGSEVRTYCSGRVFNSGRVAAEDVNLLIPMTRAATVTTETGETRQSESEAIDIGLLHAHEGVDVEAWADYSSRTLYIGGVRAPTPDNVVLRHGQGLGSVHWKGHGTLERKWLFVGVVLATIAGFWVGLEAGPELRVATARLLASDSGASK